MIVSADYVIVGAGSAGCVLANRLSADPDVRVLLLEAGGRDSSFLYRMPAGFFALMKSGQGNWRYETVPQTGLGGRANYFPRGKVLGGSSAINGLVVSRGNAADYDHWARLGNRGWSYQECLPYFMRLEDFPEGNAECRGRDGPIRVTRSPREQMNPTSRAWIEAALQAGYPFNPDVNSGDPFGVAQMQGNYGDGERHSGSLRYLRPIAGRSNLQVMSGAQVVSITFSGNCASGVEFVRDGRKDVAHAAREVLLCGGVVNTPQLLQLSGIGDPEDLRPHGIAVRHQLTGVGRSLRDHIAVSVKQKITKPYSLLSSLKPVATARALSQYLLFKSGPLSVSALEAWAHLKSSPDRPHADLQVYAVPLMYNDHGREIIKQEGFMAVMNGAQPKSTGSIRIVSADPLKAPAIDPRYFSDPEDLRVARDGIRLVREIIAQRAYDDFRGAELAPGSAVNSDRALDDYIRGTANTLYHPVGTCRMGIDPLAVVDPELCVHGLERLRVVDASVFPQITSGNTNFPVMMIAERAADLIAGRMPLSNARAA